MSFRNRFTSLCNRIFPCLNFAEELSDSEEDGDHKSQGSSVVSQLPDSVIREILLKFPIKSIIRYRGVCKAWYQLTQGLSDESNSNEARDKRSHGSDSSCLNFAEELSGSEEDGDHKSHGSDSSVVSELPYSVVREILLKLPIKSIIRCRYVCKAWYQLPEELSYESNMKEDGDKKSHGSDFSYVNELPDSVIHEILLKLPIKNIVRCRYVCKSWYRLILGPYFANVYFKSSPFNVIAISQHWTYSECPDHDDRSFCYIEIGRNGDITHKPLNLEAATSPVMGITKEKKSWKNIIGSCDGLLCVLETTYDEYFSMKYRSIHSLNDPNKTIWIVNPLTGEYIALPKVHGVNNGRVVYGFGSTVDGDHYKVVRVSMRSFGLVNAHILTIGADEKWRDLDHSPMPLRLHSQGVSFNGVLHWVGDGGHVDTPHGVIFAFDTGKETGHCFTLPCDVGHRALDIHLAVWDGHLCITDSSNELQVDIWTMKQYGVLDSWRRDIILKSSIPCVYHLIPITTMRNGDLLLSRRYAERLFSFDPKTKNCVVLEDFDPERENAILFGYAYTPSFFSPRDIISRQISVFP